MPSQESSLTVAYSELSSLYKNPTRNLNGIAASNQDEVLTVKHAVLLERFNKISWGTKTEKSAIYFKVLALLYEVDRYRGQTKIERLILGEPMTSVAHFKTHKDNSYPLEQREKNFADPAVRSLWKAKVRCCVAAIEIKRKNSHSDSLLHELSVLEVFILDELHQPKDGRPAWTTLAFVYVAQARVARQGKDFNYVRNKLLNVVECLDLRAAEIVDKLKALVERISILQQRGKNTIRKQCEVQGLEDDLIFIRQKLTLAISFMVGLGNLQRGFLDSANRACQAARFQFRLHGQTFHALYNELLLIAIKRARTTIKDKDYLLTLKAEVEKILVRLEPKGEHGNPKLYVYGLRELAVIENMCLKFAEVRKTLSKIESEMPLSPQLKSRVALLRARALYGGWQQLPCDIRDKDATTLLDAIQQCDEAFMNATGGAARIASQADVPRLLAFIRSCGDRNLIDIMESLITYGTAQLFLKAYFHAVGEKQKGAEAVQEAMKTAQVVKELSGSDNPRLLAMAHLVLADSYRESDLIFEARKHVDIAKALEAQIQHKYVEDRRKAIEEKIPLSFTLSRQNCGNISQAEDKLLGWYVGSCEDKSSINKIALQLGIGRKRLTDFIKRQGPSSPYHQLLPPPRSRK